MKALGIAAREHLPRFVSQQVYYSLQERSIEYELIPMALDQGLGTLVWSPLAGGLLSGKYRRGQDAPEGTRHVGEWDEPPVYDEDALYDTIDVLVEVAEGRGVSAAQVALAWLLTRPRDQLGGVGARTDEQLADNLKAAELELTDDELAPAGGGQPAAAALPLLASGQDAPQTGSAPPTCRCWAGTSEASAGRSWLRRFFIVGNDRSGTTMLRLILDAGPEVAIPPESMILTDYGAVWEAGELGDPAVAAAVHGGGLAAPQDRPVGARRAAARGAAGPRTTSGAYRFVDGGAVSRLRRPGRQAALGRQDPALRPPHRRAARRLAPGALRDPRPRRARRRAVGPAHAVRPQQRVGGGAVVGARASGPASAPRPRIPSAVMTVRYEDLVAAPGEAGCPRSAPSSG